MNAADVVKLLEKKGITRSESSIKYIARKYGLYLSEDPASRTGLDPKKVQVLVGVLSSPLRVAEIARQCSVTYSHINYYIMKYKVPVRKICGISVLKNKKDLDYVKSFL